MSHTYFQKETTFIGNIDLSGNVLIVTKDGELSVNGKDIINFVVEHLKCEMVSNIETMNNEDFIKIFLNTR